MKQMLVHVNGDRMGTAVLQDGRLVDFKTEPSGGGSLVGNIYKGRIVNVLPGMEAAFVDIGLAKNAFLYIDDLLHPHLDKQPERKPSIAELARPGDEVVVQVVKDPLGGKGARVTTHYNLPGRWLVYMPEADYVGVSKKIGSDEERERLRQIGEELRIGEEGVIMRTAAEGESAASLREDAAGLRKLWASVRARAAESKAPCLLHGEAGLLYRAIRDTLTQDMDEVWIDDAAACEEALGLLGKMAPGLRERVRLFEPGRGDGVGLFRAFRVQEQLDAAFARRIPLDCGGYLVWEETEALTVVDVNTGRYTGGRSLEETVFQANMEAAETISRLLRLRDVGGIVIIDFIDMELEEHKSKVMGRMLEEARKDSTKCTIVGWTRLGLMELTRKKARGMWAKDFGLK